MNMSILDTFSHSIENHINAQDNQFVGMIGMFRGKELLLCGKPLAKLENFENVLTSNNCHGFNFETYSMVDRNISLNSDRIFSQSVMLENGTVFVMGGFNVGNYSSILKSTEYLNTNSSEFLMGPDMPDHAARHCAKLINSSHILTSGGIQELGPVAKGLPTLSV